MRIDYSNIFVQIPSYVFWKDLNSVFLGCNKEFAIIAGLSSPEEIVGKSDYDLAWGESHADLYRQGDLEVLEGYSKHGVREPQLKANGELSTIILSKVPLLNSQQQKIGVIGNYIEYIDPQLTGQFDKHKENIAITPKQAECLFHIAKGLLTKQIADEMQISVRTAEFHIENLKRKLNCRNKSGLVTKALQLNFIKARLIQSK